MARNALGTHLALVGFMGAGKSTLGPQLADRLGRAFVSIDAVVEQRVKMSVAGVFDAQGEAGFRALEEEAALDVLSRRPPTVVELGGGALASARTREALAEHAFTLHLDVEPREAWERVADSGRPLARDHDAFLALHAERAPLYEGADASARDLEGTLLAAAS